VSAPTALLRHDGDWLTFETPVAVLAAHALSEVCPLLGEAEAWAARGGWAVGFLAYEAAPALDPTLTTQPPDPELPLAWFGLFAQPAKRPADAGLLTAHTPLSNRQPGSKADNAARPRQHTTRTAVCGLPAAVDVWSASQDASDYARAIDAIRAAIARGETYQINYSLRLHAEAVDGWGVMARLAHPRPAPYAAWLDTGRFAIASGSPELFFALDGETIWSHPMKGTRPRGRWAAEDEAIARELVASEKDRAENVMIVDMIRNDLGQIATLGSVQVPALFTAERYPTVWQMTSTVRARTTAPVTEILAALFPCASITGAPKTSTMAHIAQLEDSPRGVYTGAIGLIGPGRRARFSVAIRTATVDQATGRGTYGVGAGILWESRAESEYAETLLKAQALTAEPMPGLFETLLWEPGDGYFLLHDHLGRLAASADFLDLVLDVGAARQALDRATADWRAPMRVRLALDPDGQLAVTAQPAPTASGPVRLALAEAPIDPGNRWLYHKTTRREVYTEALETARRRHPACDDIVLWNPDGAVTETSIGNLVLELDGACLTPPVSAGLLPGVFRGHLLATGQIRESPMTVADLGRATQIWRVNSVRRWQVGELIGDTRTE
jgi:para-aminobenzoate synthetase/4-amino-4-deoxychorismate lyase